MRANWRRTTMQTLKSRKEFPPCVRLQLSSHLSCWQPTQPRLQANCSNYVRCASPTRLNRAVNSLRIVQLQRNGNGRKSLRSMKSDCHPVSAAGARWRSVRNSLRCPAPPAVGRSPKMQRFVQLRSVLMCRNSRRSVNLRHDGFSKYAKLACVPRSDFPELVGRIDYSYPAWYTDSREATRL